MPFLPVRMARLAALALALTAPALVPAAAGAATPAKPAAAKAKAAPRPAAKPPAPDPASGSDADATRAGEPLTALVIVDVQNFYFAGGQVPLVNPIEASLQASRLLERFRQKGWPVIHVLHLAKDQQQPTPDAGEESYRAHRNVMPRDGEVVIGKRHANGFRETALQATLERLGVKRIVLAGMQTHMCVEATARAASDLGLEVLLARDACATRQLQYGKQVVPAAQVQATALATLDGTYARVASTELILSELR